MNYLNIDHNNYKNFSSISSKVDKSHTFKKGMNGQINLWKTKFNKNQLIPLDAIYTGKMMFGILELISKDYFPKGSSILAVHTGGLQGNKGMNQRFGFSLP